MIGGQWLLDAALVLGAVSLLVQAVALRTSLPKRLAWTRYLLPASIALVSIALVLLVYAFLASRLDLEYVFLYSRVGDPWHIRLVGVWAAQKGTILLWTAMTAWAILWFQAKSRRSARVCDDEGFVRQWTLMFSTLIYVAFLWLSARQGTFNPTAEALLVARPDGNGLNPLLHSPYILIHPPLEFLGYALLTAPAAAALAYLATGDRRWSAVVRLESRVAWIMYTLGLAIGGMWAYTTLSFGGYWAWDPVEVANLVPWIILTAFLHARSQHESHGGHRVLAPLLAIASLGMTWFQTVATRSGLWISVHAFTDPTGTFARDPFLRLVNILHVDEAVAAIVGIMAALLFLTLALATRASTKEHSPYRWGVGGFFLALAGAFLVAPATMVSVTLELAAWIAGGRTVVGCVALLATLVLLAGASALQRRQQIRQEAAPLFSRQGLLFWGVVVLVTGSLAILMALLHGVNGLNRKVYDDWIPILALPVVLLMIPAFAHGHYRSRTQWIIMLGALVTGTVAAQVWRPWPVALLAPGLAAAIVVGLLRIHGILAPSNRAAPIRWTTGLLLVGGIVGLIHWSNPPTPVGWGDLSYPDHPVIQVLGLLVSAGTVTLLVPAARSTGRSLLLAVAVMELALWGYGISSLMGAVALGLLIARPTDFSNSGLRHAWKTSRRILRPAGIHTIHLAILLALAGYAVSTYAASPAQDHTITRGGVVGVGSHELRFEGVRFEEDASDPGRVGAIDAILSVHRDGTFRGESVAGFHWVDQVQHYDPETHILRTPLRDLYVASTAFCIDPTARCQSQADWIEAHENGVAKLEPDTPITAVAFQVRELPFMAPLWASVYLFTLATIWIVAGDSTRQAASTPAPKVAQPDSRPDHPTATGGVSP